MRTLTIIVTITALATPAAADDDRTVDFGPDWNRIVRCESRGDAQAISHTADRGLFQFQRRTWEWVAETHNRPELADRDPRDVTAAQQLRQAIRLRDMNGGGMHHWVCWRYRNQFSPAPVNVHSEAKQPRKPGRCARNLARRHNVPWRIATSVCGHE